MRTNTLSLCALLALGTSLVGCGDDGTMSPMNAPSLGNNTFQAPVAVTRSMNYRAPADATPDGNGTTIYFVAQGGTNGAGVFKVPAAGGDAMEVATGTPFVNPVGVAIGSDSQRLFVADPQAAMGGAIYALSVNGSMPVAVAGTQGTAPRGLEVVRVNGVDQLYFTGRTTGGMPAVFRMPAAGGAVTVVAQGAPLVSPSGVTATRNGVVYVSDRGEGSSGVGSVYRVEGTTVTRVATNVRLGDPAGVALSPDDAVLGVSSMDAQSGGCQVLLIHLATGQTGVFNDVIGMNRAAGGVHRAHGGTSSMLAWADLSAGLRGTVYRIEFR